MPTMQDYLTKRRSRVADALKLANEVLVIGAGEPLPIPGGADQTYRFIPHAEYRYLADRATPSAVVAYDPQAGWLDFLPPVTEDERIWEGRQPFDWGEAKPLTDLGDWLAARRGRPVVNLGCQLQDIASDPARVAEVREALMQARRPKDSVEIDRIRRAVAATAAGFTRASEAIKPGATERDVQIEMEAEFFRRGADRTGYGSIVGSGPNSAILHFDPSARKIGAGELVLIDAGGEIDGYTADVTRTYAGDGQLQGFAADLYQVVLKAQMAAIARCTPGAEFRENHLACARDMAQGLIDLGVLRGNAAQLVDRDAHALFFPHGLGHLVGLGVRDASGYLPGRQRSTRFGLKFLRIDLPLQPDYVVTIEPGLYFIPAILQDPERRHTFADAVNWSLADKHINIGGIRIEDDILATTGAPEVLTREIPK
ncbi:MAG TPA: aminopeptidase P family protein [Phycisphaerae bacterium]|nr:aminopeptidase P family protein [Phycisphaerae bacterium]